MNVYGQHLCGKNTVDRVILTWWGRCRAAHMCGAACFKYVRWQSKISGGWSGLVSVTFGLIIGWDLVLYVSDYQVSLTIW